MSKAKAKATARAAALNSDAYFRATIMADAREREGANPFLEAAVSVANRTILSPTAGGAPIAYIIDTITVGDYVIMAQAPNQRNFVPVLVIERKTWKDLAASIKDSRSKTQHARMVELQQKTHCQCIYLIEGMFKHNDDQQVQGLHFKALHSKIRHNTLLGIPFIQSRDQAHSAKVIVDLARDILKLLCEKRLSFPGLHANSVLEAEYEKSLRDLRTKYVSLGVGRLSAIESRVTAEEIVPHLGSILSATEPEAPIDDSVLDVELTDTIPDEWLANPIDYEAEAAKTAASEGSALETAIDASSAANVLQIPNVLKTRTVPKDADVIEKMWCSLPGIGDKLAPELRKHFKIRDIIIAQHDEREAWLQKLSDLTYPNGSRLGRPRAEKIMELAGGDITVTGMAKLRDTSRKVLEAIPGVSAGTAQLILNNFSLRQICQNEITQEQIANIPRGGAGAANRRLGPAIAAKVLKYMA